jgi:hypothetical protein
MAFCFVMVTRCCRQKEKETAIEAAAAAGTSPNIGTRSSKSEKSPGNVAASYSEPVSSSIGNPHRVICYCALYVGYPETVEFVGGQNE